VGGGPAVASRYAAVDPAGPPPTTTTSHRSLTHPPGVAADAGA